MNRTLIFGLPRTGTTILEEFFSQKNNSAPTIEPYGQDIIRKNYIDFTKKIKPNSVVKLLTTNCVCHNPVDVPSLMGLNVFDRVIVTKRSDNIDTCLSLYYADYVANKWQWNVDEQVIEKTFVCDPQFAANFKKEISLLHKIIAWFDEIDLPYDVFDYDDFLLGKEQIILGSVVSKNCLKSKFKKSNLDYKTLCVNYHEIKELIDDESC